MNHKENYTNLLNTLTNVETRGNNTIIIVDCMRFLGQCIKGCEQEEARHGLEDTEAPKEATEEGE